MFQTTNQIQVQKWISQTGGTASHCQNLDGMFPQVNQQATKGTPMTMETHYHPLSSIYYPSLTTNINHILSIINHHEPAMETPQKNHKPSSLRLQHHHSWPFASH